MGVSSGFIVSWSADRIRAAGRSGWIGKRVPYLFGGPHTSHPSPRRYGVSAGDRIFPTGFKGGRLMILCECIVEDVIDVDAFYQSQKPASNGGDHDGLYSWLNERSCGWLAPTCTDDAVLLRDATPLVLDRFVPLDQMASIRLVTRKAERGLNKLLPDGRLSTATGMTGHYFRTTPATADLLAAVTRGELGG